MPSAADLNRKMAPRIAKQLVRGAFKGLNAARIFLVSRIKEELSVAAPRKVIRGMNGAIVGYRATTPAKKGAPPRKLSGRMRASVWSKLVNDGKTVVIGLNARSPQGFNYPRYHELPLPGSPNSAQHRYLYPTAIKWRRQLTLIIGQRFQIIE